MTRSDILSRLKPCDDFGFAGAIFDFDGTLADSMYVWAQVDREFMSRHNLVEPPEYGDMLAKLGFNRGAVYTAELFGLPQSPQEIKDEWNALAQDCYANEVFLKSGCREYLQQLRACGATQLSIATTLTTPLLEAALELNGIMDLFDTLVTSSIVNIGKDHPDIYLYAAEKMGVSPESCVVFEDIAPGLRSAKNAGMTAVGVHDAQGTQTIDELHEAADVVIESFEVILG